MGDGQMSNTSAVDQRVMAKISSNSTSLAGEFAVLSQLALRNYDANMTLGRTKSVDILVSNPTDGRMYQLEVKTNFKNSRDPLSKSQVHGNFLSGWIMHKKHESIATPSLFYCFVNILKDTNSFKFYIVPSKVVAQYVKEQHVLWLQMKKAEGKAVKDSDMRIFRIGNKAEKYRISTPTAEQYENNWDFNP
jgi:hypothetical protein